MKVLGLAVVRTGKDLEDPIPMSVATDLSSFGFFQRQVRLLLFAVVVFGWMAQASATVAFAFAARMMDGWMNVGWIV